MRGLPEGLLDAFLIRRVKDVSAVIPVCNVYGEAVGETVYLKTGTPKYQHYFQEKYAIFNEQCLKDVFPDKPVVVVEGIFDALSLIEFGIPAIAMYSNTLKHGQLEKIARYTNKLMFWPDSDSDGEAGVERSIKKAKKYGISCAVFRCSLAKDANDLLQMSEEWFRDVVKELRGELVNV